MLFIIKDFILSRQGKIIVVSLTIVLAIVYFTRNHDKKLESPPVTATKSNVWDDENANDNALIQQKEKNRLYKPFNPVPLSPEKSAPVSTSRPKPEIQILAPAIEPTKAIAPLIKEERAISETVAVKEVKPLQLPTLEPGAIIHCRLLAPATTEQANAPVIAEITRPVIRDGIILISKGRRLSGSIKTSKNKRVFFAPDWHVSIRSNKQISLSGHVQEKSYNAKNGEYSIQDGRLGLPGFLENAPQTKKANLLGNVVKGIAKIGKGTVRTAAGEYVPASGRNAAIDIGTSVVEGIIPQQKKISKKQEPYILVPAGREFYLVIISSNQSHSGQPSQETSIDQLWAEAMRKRLSQDHNPGNR